MKRKEKIHLPPAVERGFKMFRRTWRFFVLNRGLLFTITGILFWILLAWAADRTLRLPQTARLVLLITTVVTSAFLLIYFGIRPLFRRMNNRRVAAQIGKELPAVEDELISAVELSDPGAQHMEGVSPALLKDALDDINERVASANFRKPVHLRRLLYPAVTAVVILGIVGAAYHFRPEAFLNAINRLVRPLQDIRFFTYTKLSVSPGNVVLARGDKESVRAMVGGKVPKTASVEVEELAKEKTPKQWLEMEWKEKEFAWDTPPLFETHRYRVHAGDAISKWYRLQVEPRPAIVSKNAVLHYPKYAARKPKRYKDLQGALEVVKYSKVEFQFRTTTAVEAWMVEGGKKLALTRKAKSSEFFSSLLEPLSKVEYAIGLRDKYNLINRGSDSIIVRVVEDSMPVIRIERPLGNLILMPHESVTVACLASDNFGVRGISLTLHKIVKDKTEKPRRVEVVKGSPTRESLTGEYVLKMSELGVQPGEQLEYTAETADFAGIPALRLSTSETFRIAVLGEQEYLRMRLGDLKRLALDVRRLAEAEHREAKSTGVLATQDTKALESTETTREAKAGAERQVQIATRTENVAKQVERVVGELARAPSVSKDLLSDVERVARALRSVESTQMAKATKGLRKAAADDKAEQRKPELEGAEVEQKDAAVRLDNLANALDKLGDLGIIKNLAKTAAHIAKVQRDLAKATGEKAPETAGMTPQELPENLKSDIEDLAQGEQDIKSEIGKLEENLRAGAAALAFGAPAAAQAAMSAAQSIASQGLPGKAGRAAKGIQGNLLFGTVPEQEDIAQALEDLAEELEDAMGDDDVLESVESSLNEFIRRQTEVISDIEARLGKMANAAPVKKTAGRQTGLRRDVLELATALDLLAMELDGFDSRTARILRSAGVPMKLAGSELKKTDDNKALPPAKEALEILKSAVEAFEAEKGEFEEAEEASGIARAMIELFRIMAEQKMINAGTIKTDIARPTLKDAELKRKTRKLARRQGSVRNDTLVLANEVSSEMMNPEDLEHAAGLMNTSKMALNNRDTGEQTRIVQKKILMILEKLAGFLKKKMMTMGQAGARGAALAGMGAMGTSGTGYFGGGNADVPLSDLPVGDQDWKRVQSKFDGKILSGWEEVVAPEFRTLVESYFESLRKGE